MKKKLLLGGILLVSLTFALWGCSIEKPEPLSMVEFQKIFDTIQGDTMELSSDTHTEKASAMLLGTMHDINIIYYQMETEEDANKLFTDIGEELDEIKEETLASTVTSSSEYYVNCEEGSYYVLKDGNIVLYGTGFEDDGIELEYLFYKLGYYEYDTTYIKNQKEVNEQTFGY